MLSHQFLTTSRNLVVRLHKSRNTLPPWLDLHYNYNGDFIPSSHFRSVRLGVHSLLVTFFLSPTHRQLSAQVHQWYDHRFPRDQHSRLRRILRLECRLPVFSAYSQRVCTAVSWSHAHSSIQRCCLRCPRGRSKRHHRFTVLPVSLGLREERKPRSVKRRS